MDALSLAWVSDPSIWLGLLTLIVLEIVLGVDNLVFIAILADKLPPEQRDRARVIGLLREAGYDVREVTLTVEDFRNADEIFTSGNYSKIVPVTKLDDRDLQEGPVARKALDLYMDWARSTAA